MVTPLFDLTWEPLTEDKALLHCEVDEWSITVARRLYKAVAELFVYLEGEGYTTAWTFSPNPRFCQHMGGEIQGGITYENINYWVYRWDLKQQQ